MKEKTIHISEQWKLVPQVGHYDSLSSVAWSPDGERILTGSWDGTVRVWDARNGVELLRLELNAEVLSVCWSPDSRHIAASREKGPVEVWDSGSGEKILLFDYEERQVACLDWSPNGAYLLAGFLHSAFCHHRKSEETGAITGAIVWNIRTGREVLRLKTGEQEDICSAAWSPDGARILTGHTAKRLPFRGSRVAVVWDGQSGRDLLRLEGHVAGITSVAWSPDGRRVLTGSRDGSARVWDSVDGRELLRLEGHTNGIFCVDWSSDGARILTTSGSSEDRTTRVWDCENGQELLKVPEGAMTARWSPDGARILAGFWEKVACIFDGRTGRELLRLGGYALNMQPLCWSPSGRFLLFICFPPVALVWDSLTRREAFRLTGHEKELKDASWSPDGRRILTCSTDGTARVWDGETGAQILCLGGHEDDMFGASKSSWSPNGKLIFTLKTCDNVILIWDAQTGRKMRSIVSPCNHCLNFHCIVWSPDGKRLLTTGNDRMARIWDVQTGREILCFGDHDEDFLAAWSPDGTSVITGIPAGCARIWDSRDGRKLSEFPGCISWSPGGEKFLCKLGQKDAFVILDRTGREVSRYEASEPITRKVFWSPDGGRVLALLENSFAVILDSASGRELARLGNRDIRGPFVWFPDGEHVVGGVCIRGQNLYCVWESRSGEERYRLYPYLDGCLMQYADGRYACDGVARVALMGNGPRIFPMNAGYEDRWRIKN
jgi:WD40 repeat protein